MKNSMIYLALISTIVACGQQDSDSSLTASSGNVIRAEAVIAEITRVAPTNGGFNPNAAALVIEGKVMIGSNRCQAEGVTVEAKVSQVGTTKFLTVYTVKPARTAPRQCTREFMPQYANFSETVRYNVTLVHDVALKNYLTLGNTFSALSLVEGAEAKTETVISDVKVQSIPGGINPDFRGLKISGLVQLGSNACVAGGARAELIEEKNGGTIYVKAILIADADSHNRICTADYRPVFAAVETNVIYDTNTIKKVTIKNVEEKGKHKSAFDLMGDRR